MGCRVAATCQAVCVQAPSSLSRLLQALLAASPNIGIAKWGRPVGIYVPRCSRRDAALRGQGPLEVPLRQALEAVAFQKQPRERALAAAGGAREEEAQPGALPCAQGCAPRSRRPFELPEAQALLGPGPLPASDLATQEHTSGSRRCGGESKAIGFRLGCCAYSTGSTGPLASGAPRYLTSPIAFLPLYTVGTGTLRPWTAIGPAPGVADERPSRPRPSPSRGGPTPSATTSAPRAATARITRRRDRWAAARWTTARRSLPTVKPPGASLRRRGQRGNQARGTWLPPQRLLKNHGRRRP